MLYQLAKIADFLDENSKHKDADLIERLIEKLSLHQNFAEFHQDLSESDEELTIEANLDLDDYDLSEQAQAQIRRTALDSLGETLIEARGSDEIKQLIEILQDLVDES